VGLPEPVPAGTFGTSGPPDPVFDPPGIVAGLPQVSREPCLTSANELSNPFTPRFDTTVTPIDSSLPAGIAAGLMVSLPPPTADLPSIRRRSWEFPPDGPMQNLPNVTIAGTPALASVCRSNPASRSSRMST